MAKVNLFNIDLKLIPDDVIIQIAENLGCDYKPPKKFTVKIYFFDEIIIEEIDNVKDEEIKKILNEEELKRYRNFKIKYADEYIIYFNKVLNWLKDNNYLVELE